MKKLRIPRESKTMVYFGQRTEKDVPFFTLSQALGVWGQAPSSRALACTSAQRSKSVTRPVQGDLFAMA